MQIDKRKEIRVINKKGDRLLLKGKDDTKNTLKIIKIIWSDLCFFVLIFFLYRMDAHSLEGTGILLTWAMYILAFPISNLVAAFYTGIIYIFENVSPSKNLFTNDSLFLNYVVMSIYWLSFFIAGYLQWFKLIPYVIRKIKNNR